MTTLFSVLMLISSGTLIGSILMQESKSEGLGAIGGGTDSMFGKSVGTSRQAMLRKVTIVSAVVFMISAVALAAV
ncbi:preprotein translocase subunit SecG [Gudongella sp. SC589]|jgi:preprotein translocase subunit SecG|uniref:preprotein translocase subunit SecG n=1 Tax=Gudongella sp. SC589 TaxID=3385990 RepID=UPI003904CB1D